MCLVKPGVLMYYVFRGLLMQIISRCNLHLPPRVVLKLETNLTVPDQISDLQMMLGH